MYAVLAIVSNSYPPLPGRLPTRYSPVRDSKIRVVNYRHLCVPLACIRHAASVRPEPGSNSHHKSLSFALSVADRFIVFLFDRFYPMIKTLHLVCLVQFSMVLPLLETTILV